MLNNAIHWTVLLNGTRYKQPGSSTFYNLQTNALITPTLWNSFNDVLSYELEKCIDSGHQSEQGPLSRHQLSTQTAIFIR